MYLSPHSPVLVWVQGSEGKGYTDRYTLHVESEKMDETAFLIEFKVSRYIYITKPTRILTLMMINAARFMDSDHDISNT
jgi:hypothetical protein